MGATQTRRNTLARVAAQHMPASKVTAQDVIRHFAEGGQVKAEPSAITAQDIIDHFRDLERERRDGFEPTTTTTGQRG